MRQWLEEFWWGHQTPSDSYFLMRRVFCTGLGLIYLNVFVIYIQQGLGLYGEGGLLPYSELYKGADFSFESIWRYLSVFHFAHNDLVIRSVGWLGLALSLVLVFGRANFFILFALWLLHMSVVHSGQIFYSYGWETQLLELTFLSFFLFPLFRTRLDQGVSPPFKIAIFYQRWMMFRLMLGAGLIKIRGDSCWRDFTCTQYHYETQPNPHPLSWYYHHLPDWFHTLEVLGNHFVELILPFGLFGPKWVRRVTGVLMILFQLTIISSGNLSWLNWITILMAIPCFDDEFLARWGSLARIKQCCNKYLQLKFQVPPVRTKVVLGLFAVAGVILSIQPALNLVSDRQAMNTSYNRLHLINSYGAFGSIGKVRNEIIISGTRGEPSDPKAVWFEYELKCKPGDLYRAPCLITPYHLRLDWQIWFSAMRPQLQEVWLLRLAIAILENKESVLDLMGSNPLPGTPPKYIKMDLYRYEFTDWGEEAWWKRRHLKSYLPAISLEHPDVKQYRVR